ncbi:protein ANTAGONIST OF LIKE HETEROCHROMATIN PROTEIN 1-like [Tasmannia lanceolata]|uniref:protein ANTAGONIST OF LIKE HETEROCHROMATIN PROTEIN 1-like n=1 Tax=Tasmannia lanceolata TaxID=3420 RepID=UPI004063BA61
MEDDDWEIDADVYTEGSGGSDDEDDLVDEVASVVCVGACLFLMTVMGEEGLFIERGPYQNHYLTDRGFVNYVVESDEHCHNLLRMNVECFRRFVNIFKESGTLKDTIHCNVDEQVAIFLHTVAHNLRNRCMKVYCRRSGETISRYFNKVLRAILSMVDQFIIPPSSETPTQIAENPRWYPYFKDCIGAIDGTHIPAKVPAEMKKRFIGRKGHPTQNVLAACDFDMKFTFVVAGWEGSTSDSRILGDAIADDFGITRHPGKFYLADAGFPLLSNFITPYRVTRYHLSEQRGCAPRTKKELFNYRHSSARNVIERAFGVLKKCFPILTCEQMYAYRRQVDIVMACCAVHNFLRGVMPNDAYITEVDREVAEVEGRRARRRRREAPDEDDSEAEEHESAPRLGRTADAREGNRIREQICTDMWNDYGAAD